MEYVKENRGVILFYLLLVVTTLAVINFNERHLSMESDYVYLTR